MINKKIIYAGLGLMSLSFSSISQSQDINTLLNKDRESQLLSVYENSKQFDSETQISKFNYQNYLEKINDSRSYLLPKIELNLDLDRTQSNEDSGTSYGASVGLKQDIYNRSSNTALSASEIQAKVYEYEYKYAKQELIVRAAEAYFNTLKAKNLVASSMASKDAFNTQMIQAKAKFDVGVVAITDYNEAKSEYDRSNAEYIQAVNDLKTSYALLEKISNSNIEEITNLNSSKFKAVLADKSENEYFKNAIDNNLEYLSLIKKKELAKKNIDVAKSGHYPTVSLSADLKNNHNKYDHYDTSSSTEAVFGININVPIYSGGQTNSQVNQSTFDYMISNENLKEKIRELQSDVKQTYNNIESSISLIDAYEQSVISAKSALKSAESGNKVGTRTILDVLDATNNLYNSEMMLSNSRYDYIVNLLKLKLLSGELTEQDIQNTNDLLI